MALDTRRYNHMVIYSNFVKHSHVCIFEECGELFGTLICSICQQKQYYTLKYLRQVKGSDIHLIE